tara:strand:- start:105 stop:764 length:660 start_codon:yes stop_codon:yes gene_type:complete
MKNRFLIALLLLLILSTYKIQNDFNNNSKFNIKNVEIENNVILNEKDIKANLTFLYETNFFFLKSNDIKKNLKEIDLIESFKIKKIYPNKIKIIIFEKEPIAILYYKKTKKYYTSKGELINFFDLEKYKYLPIVFGDRDNFKKFYNSLKILNFPIEEIKEFYLFESNRWDLITKKNQTVKLPNIDYKKSLQNFLELKNKTGFKKYKIFDYRITGQLILQ